MARRGLNRGAPQFQVVLLAVFGKELGVVAPLGERRRGREIVAHLFLEFRLDRGILEQVLAIEIDLDEGFHRNAEHVAIAVLEVVDEGREHLRVEVRRREVGIVGERLRDVHQEIARQIGIDDVLLDVDEIVDARIGLHVLDGLVVHLIPGRRLELDVDSGGFGEGRGQDVLDVVRRRRALRDATYGRACVWRARFRPEVGE